MRTLGRLKSILPALLYCAFACSCAFIPTQEQLVSATWETPPVRSNGNCVDAGNQRQQSSESQPGLAPDSIALFDWNIQKEQNQGWDIDFKRLSRGADIIFLQEAALQASLVKILQQKNMYWNFNSAFKHNGVESGVLTASIIQPLTSCGLRTSEPVIRIPKTILINTYPLTGSATELMVANIHGINITLGTGSYQQQMDSLKEILQEHTGPIILAGDFNNWNKDRTVIMANLIKTLSLQAFSFEDEQRSTFFGDPVDHILYRGLKPVSYEVTPVTSSDHNPIAVTFRLEKSQPGMDNYAW
jgi:endonuclease/exonuclease/phosphatase (EEP) superfamily protein YafD